MDPAMAEHSICHPGLPCNDPSRIVNVQPNLKTWVMHSNLCCTMLNLLSCQIIILIYSFSELNKSNTHFCLMCTYSPFPKGNPKMVLQAWRPSTAQSHSVTSFHWVCLLRYSSLLQKKRKKRKNIQDPGEHWSQHFSWKEFRVQATALSHNALLYNRWFWLIASTAHFMIRAISIIW